MQLTLIQSLLANNQVNSRYIDDQNLISKLNLIELLQKHEKYMCLDSSYNSKYYKRIETTLQFIPDEHKKAALSLFANVFYVGESILSDSLVYLFKEIVALHENNEGQVVSTMHIFEVDPSGLLETFFRINKIAGRLDSDTFSRCKSVGELISSLYNYMCCSELQDNDALITNISGVLKKDIWILLTDFSFSGTSLKSDIEKLLKIREICFDGEKKPKIFVCVQIISSKAIEDIEKEFRGEIKILYAQNYGHDVRIVPEDVWAEEKIDPVASRLFEEDRETYQSVLKLCEWFGNEYIDKDPEHKPTKDQTKGEIKTLAFGYKKCGFTVIPQRNAPSNSLPILWYTPSKQFKETFQKDFIPPFPRTTSRVSQSTSGDKKHLDQLEKKKDDLTNLLEKIYSNQADIK